MRNIVESGEEMRFENEEIHFKTSLTIEGSVVYENCKIFCYEDGCEASIELEGYGKLTFRGCEIVFCGAKGDNEYFIDSDDDNINWTLEMEDCKVLNANYFAKSSHFSELNVGGCEFLNGVQYLFVTKSRHENGSHIFDCKFLSTALPDFIDMDDNTRFGPLLDDSDGFFSGIGLLTVTNCTFEFDADMNRRGARCYSPDSSIEDCTFVNDNGVPAARLSGYTTCLHCKFDT